MNKKITGLLILFFFLFTLAYGESGRVKLAWALAKPASECAGYPDAQKDDVPADAQEEDASEGRETDGRELDEYESPRFSFQLCDNPLLNAQYTHQHLLFKDHFLEAAVPPPRC